MYLFLQYKMILILFFYCSLTVVPIFPHSPPLPCSPLAPSVNPHPFVHVYGSFIPVLSLDPSPSYIPCTPPTSPLVPAHLFLDSMTLVLFCSFVCFLNWVPVIDEIIWNLYFADWLISLSIILSSSNHTIEKGRSSFFLLYSILLCKCTTVF